MATVVTMPKMGMTMEEGTIVRWHREEGSHIDKGEPLLEIMTDKITMDVESPASGIVVKVLAHEGETVKVHEPIALIALPGESWEHVLDEVRRPALAQKQSEEPPDTATGAEGPAEEGGFCEPGEAAVRAPRATPAARALARSHGLDLRLITGSGPDGRIERRDVEAYLAGRGTPTPGGAEPAKDAPRGRALPGDGAGSLSAQGVSVQGVSARSLPLQGIRGEIARRMLLSWTTVPHVTLTVSVCMAAAIELRQRLIPYVQERFGVRLTLTDVIIKATTAALRRHPRLNSTFEGDRIVLHDDINIGIAVALEEGIVVPVVHTAHALSLGEIAFRRHQLVGKARAGELRPDDLHSATFTVTNLGQYGVETFTPIISPPETGILGVGAAHNKPTVENDEIVVRPVAVLNLSIDHRAVDGATGAAFLATCKELLEDPRLLLV